MANDSTYMVFGIGNSSKYIPFACSYNRQRCVDYSNTCFAEREAKVKKVDSKKAARLIPEYMVNRI